MSFVDLQNLGCLMKSGRSCEVTAWVINLHLSSKSNDLKVSRCTGIFDYLDLS